MRTFARTFAQKPNQALERVLVSRARPDEKRIQPQAAPAAHQETALDAAAAVSAINQGGAPLPSEVRSYFEPRFGYDFSRVRVHADAAQGAGAVHARAYTLGSDIAFAPGAYAPATTEGKRLLAHELAHVVQQGQAPQEPQINRQPAPADQSPGKQPKSGAGPQDVEQIKKDMCVAQPVDETKARCQFSDRQLSMVRIIRDSALRICKRAIPAVNMPGNEAEVKRIAREYLHLNIKLTERTRRALVRTIRTVADKLEHSPIECGTCQDERCNGGAIAHVDDARTLIVLCPRFFNSELHKVHLTPRYLIHEAGHLAGLDQDSEMREEFYCDQGATKDDKCPVGDARHNVDAWSHFIEELAYTI